MTDRKCEPFPSDRFTVPDATQRTGMHVERPKAGLSQPRIATAPTHHYSADTPAGVAVDSSYVYWTNPGRRPSIGRANLDGTQARMLIRHGRATSYPIAVAVDSSHLYWANWDVGTISRANLDGTGVNRSFITGADHPFGVAVHAGLAS